MSRIAKQPVFIPDNVEVICDKHNIIIKGEHGILNLIVNKSIKIILQDSKLIFVPYKEFSNAWSHAGTTRSLVNSMIIGVTKGFSKKIILSGVGYRAIIKDNIIILSLGYSHQIKYVLPKQITAECISQTEIIIKGANKQAVNQTAAEIRNYRPSDPYKNKGIKYDNEIIKIKEVKKK